MRYMFAKKPELAEEFADKTTSKQMAALPQYSRKNSQLKELSTKHMRKKP